MSVSRRCSWTYQCASGIKNIDIKERNQRETELAAMSRDVPLLDREGLGDLVKIDDLPEEVERIIADGRIGEMREHRGSRPGDDANK